MRSSKKASFYLFTTALVVVPAAAITACGDDDTTGGDPVLLDGSADGRAQDARSQTDGPVSPTDARTNDAPFFFDSGSDSGGDSGNDSGNDASDSGPDSGVDSGVDSGKDAGDAGADADADAATPPTPGALEDATYKITAWTCTDGVTTKDILNVATTAPINLSEINITITGSTSVAHSVFNADCTRSTPQVITYPEAGKITFASSANYTCSNAAPKCTTSQCDPSKTQAALTDTYVFTKTSTSFTGVRTLVAANLVPEPGSMTLQKVAGCDVGWTENATYTKK